MYRIFAYVFFVNTFLTIYNITFHFCPQNFFDCFTYQIFSSPFLFFVRICPFSLFTLILNPLPFFLPTSIFRCHFVHEIFSSWIFLSLSFLLLRFRSLSLTLIEKRLMFYQNSYLCWLIIIRIFPSLIHSYRSPHKIHVLYSCLFFLPRFSHQKTTRFSLHPKFCAKKGFPFGKPFVANELVCSFACFVFSDSISQFR